MGIISRRAGHAEPASEDLMSEPAIIGRIAELRWGTAERSIGRPWCANYDRIRDHITTSFPRRRLQRAHPGGTSSICLTTRGTGASPYAVGKASSPLSELVPHRLAAGQYR